MVAIGWGAIATDPESYPDILQQVTVRSISRHLFGCASTLHYSRRQFCAGLPEGDKDSCQGDSGGPLMSFRSRRWYIDGTTSYGDGCGLSNHPGVYARVTFYVPWIN